MTDVSEISGFTTGPWTISCAKSRTDGEYDWAICAQIDGCPHVIGEAFGRAAENVRPNAESNARMFAAAPDMHAEIARLRIVTFQAQEMAKEIVARSDAEIARLRAELDATKFKCKYRNSGAGGNDPQECAWPTCGCDPAADRFIAYFQESGLVLVEEQEIVMLRALNRGGGFEIARLREENDKLIADYNRVLEKLDLERDENENRDDADEIARLRREKEALVEELTFIVNNYVLEPETICRARAALRSAAETATYGDDGGDPNTTELLKPRGNNGIVSADICYDALLLIGDRGVTEKHVASWTQEERDVAYDWAIRIHLSAADNDGVFVPAPPACVRSATETKDWQS